MCVVCSAKAGGFSTFTADLAGASLTGDPEANGAILPIDDADASENVQSNVSVYELSDFENEKTTFSTDEIADQIARWNAKWDDNDPTTGDIVDGVFRTNAIGTPGVVTYGYLRDETIDTIGVPSASHRAMSAAELAQVEYAISLVASVANIEFQRVTGADGTFLDDRSDANMQIMAQVGTNGGWASTARSSSAGKIYSSLVNIGERDLEVPGSYAFLTAMHEVGHAIGLAHPGDYNGSGAINYATEAEYFQDSRQFTIMSYWSERETGADFGWGRFSTNLMLHDIATLQHLYGVNTTAYTEGTTYGFNSNTGDIGWTLDGTSDYFIGSIWDAGGIDTIDVSGFGTNQAIDLREEAFSSTGTMNFNLSIARGVKIENAIGGSGNDLLVGNNADSSFVDAMNLTYLGEALPEASPGYSGSNLLDGGQGFDTVSYEFGVEAVNIDLANGEVFDLGANGQDTLRNIEALVGTQFGDSLAGNTLNNDLDGGAGDDTLRGATGGEDLLIGGDGSDTVDYTRYQTALQLDLAATQVLVDDGKGVSDTLQGIENVLGTNFSDSIDGTSEDNALHGNDGADTLMGREGNDLLRGGDGGDLLYGDFIEDEPSPADPITVDPSDGGAVNLEGTSGDNTLIGAAGDDSLVGLGGNDLLVGNDGADTLLGGDGADTLELGAGNDQAFGEAGNDVLVAGAGSNTLDGGGGNDTLSVVNESLLAASVTAIGGGGDDLITGGDLADALEGGLGNDSIAGLAGNDTLRGGDEVDTLDGGAGDDALYGGNSGIGVAYDVIIGGDGNDTLYGENGDDYLLGGAGNDSLLGGDGYDYLSGGEGVDTLDAGLGGGALYAFDIEVGYAVNMVAGTVTAAGSTEVDTIIGLWDVFGSNVGDDTIIGDGFASYFDGFGGDDYVDGGDGDDTLIGRSGSDTLIGGDGNDVIDGGFASAGDATDVATGGAGDDTFFMRNGYDSLTVTDFTHGEDVLDLRFYSGATSLSSFSLVQNGADVVAFLSGGETVRFLSQDLAAFGASDFVFASALPPLMTIDDALFAVLPPDVGAWAA